MVNEDGLPLAMRKPRKAKGLISTQDAWWYVNPSCVEIFADYRAPGQTTAQTCVRLTRKQLERALEIMDVYARG